MDVKTEDPKALGGFYLCQLQQYDLEQTNETTINSNVLNLSSPVIQTSQSRIADTLLNTEELLLHHNADQQILASQTLTPQVSIHSTEVINIQELENISQSEKVAIYSHPLYPLLHILFEKCEIATNSIEHINSVSFDQELKLFVAKMAKANKPFFTEDAEVDTLMLKALQVLAIHLLELEKVNELCKDFCTRYISCLKGKLNSENIMKTLDIKSTPPESPSAPAVKEDFKEECDNSVQAALDEKPLQQQQSNTPLNSPATRSTSMSIPIRNEKVVPELSRSVSLDSATMVPTHLNGMTVEELTSGFLSKKNKGGKRGTLPKSATNVLKAWLFQHLVHPYPSEEEKKQLAEQTNLSNLQVNNWFINARRRILQPMLDSSNSVLKNNKRSKQPRNAAQKCWSNTIGVYNSIYHSSAAESSQSSITSHTIAGQHHLSSQHVGIVVSPVVQQGGTGTMLLNFGEGTHNQPVIITQPLQFVQVNQLPLQATSGFLPVHSIATLQAPVVSSTEQASIEPTRSEQE